MRGLEDVGEALAKWLREGGMAAVTAWGRSERKRPGEPVTVVSLRGLESGPPGFQDYLGEEYDPEKGWTERYGKRVTLTFGLDVYAAGARQVREGLDRLSGILGQGGPRGLRPVGFSFGETVYEEGSRRFFCPVTARFFAWAVAEGREEEVAFLDFEVRGERDA